MNIFFLKIRKVFEDDIASLSLKTVIFVFITFLIISIWKWNLLPPKIPLLYSLPRGEEQLVTPQVFILIPVSALCLFIINLFLSSFYFQKEKLVMKILMSIAVISAILLLITYIKIIFLIT